MGELKTKQHDGNVEEFILSTLTWLEETCGKE